MFLRHLDQAWPIRWSLLGACLRHGIGTLSDKSPTITLWYVLSVGRNLLPDDNAMATQLGPLCLDTLYRLHFGIYPLSDDASILDFFLEDNSRLHSPR